MEKSLTFGDLFSGPGGLSLGLEMSQFDGKYNKFISKWAIDDHIDSCETYKKNLSPDEKVNIYCEDIKKFNLESLEQIDMLTFGFPCNDFSLVGEKLGFKGKYGPLYSYGIKILKLLSPKCFIAENVSGLSSSNEGKAFEKIKKDLVESGYEIHTKKFKLEEYGIPQSRHRIIIVGFRNDLKINYIPPEPTYEIITSKEALNGMPKDLPNNELTRQSNQVIERLKFIKPGQNAWSKDIPDELKLNVKGAKLSNIYKRLDPDKPSYTVTGSGGGGIILERYKRIN